MLNEGGHGELNHVPNASATNRMPDALRLRLTVAMRLGARLNGVATRIWKVRRVRVDIERGFKNGHSTSSVNSIVLDVGFSTQGENRRVSEQDGGRSLGSAPRSPRR